MSPLSSRKKWEVALVLVTALWGWSFVAIHEALAFMSASTFNAYRFLTGTIFMALFLLNHFHQFSKKDIIGGLLTGVALYLASLFQTSGLALTSASNASFITGLAVVFTPVFAIFLLSVRPEKKQIAGAILAAIGLAFLTLKGFSIRIGDVLILMCAICFALHIVLLSKFSKVTNVFYITFMQISVVGTLSFFQSLLTDEFVVPKQMDSIITIVIMGIIGTALGIYIQTKAQVASSPNRIALILVLEPLFGGLFGYFLAGDRLTILNWVGAVLIIFGMLVTELNFNYKKYKCFS